MGWISVKDRLPSEGVDILVWDGNLNLDNICRYEIAAYRLFANGGHFISGPYSLQGITHWMPLPEPPSGIGCDAEPIEPFPTPRRWKEEAKEIFPLDVLGIDEDKDSTIYFMTQMTQEEFEQRTEGRKKVIYEFNKIKR